MHDRMQRYVIPATVVIMTAVLTIWLGAIPKALNASIWKDLLEAGNAGIITAVITVAITNYGLGYICHAIFCAIMFFNRRQRLIDTDRVLQAFGVQTASGKKVTNKQLDALLGEFHIRFHSRAPESLREHCTRRNSAWYITKTCAIAAVTGFVVAVVYVSKSGNLDLHWKPLLIWGFLLSVFTIVSWIVGTRWNIEFWEVAWNWLAQDLKESKLSDTWRQRNRFDC